MEGVKLVEVLNSVLIQYKIEEFSIDTNQYVQRGRQSFYLALALLSI